MRNEAKKACASKLNPNLVGIGYKIDLTNSPFADENPVLTTKANTPSSPPYLFCMTSVPENKKCFSYIKV